MRPVYNVLQYQLKYKSQCLGHLLGFRSSGDTDSCPRGPTSNKMLSGVVWIVALLHQTEECILSCKWLNGLCMQREGQLWGPLCALTCMESDVSLSQGWFGPHTILTANSKYMYILFASNLFVFSLFCSITGTKWNSLTWLLLLNRNQHGVTVWDNINTYFTSSLQVIGGKVPEYTVSPRQTRLLFYSKASGRGTCVCVCVCVGGVSVRMWRTEKLLKWSWAPTIEWLGKSGWGKWMSWVVHCCVLKSLQVTTGQ